MGDRPVVLVTGGTGAVGPAVVDRLLAEGCRVRVLTRGRMPSPWPEGRVGLARGDVGDRAAVAEAVRGADWVFHLSSYVHPAAAPADVAECERVNVEGTRVVAEESARAGVARLVFFGTIAVYGPTEAGVEADENSAARPESPAAVTKLRAEEAVRGADGRGRLRTTILRASAVYGPRVKGQYARLLRALSSGWFTPVGPGLNRRTLVYERDLAEAALQVACSRRAAGRLYNVSDGQVHTLRDVIEAQCLALGRRAPRLRVPLPPARAAARVADRVLAAAGRRARLTDLLGKYTEDVAVRADRIRDEIGFRPRFDLRSGWEETVRSWR
ncbi:MAG TPA: NAD-dependent epimerase/dehydratase family protein [Vicinamibacteria bacterium]